MFQKQALSTFDKVVKVEKKPRIILWTSDLTKYKKARKYLDPHRYIIQVWTDSKDKHVIDLLNEGYDVIVSNHDFLYLDGG